MDTNKELKEKFVTGAIPTEQDYHEFIDYAGSNKEPAYKVLSSETDSEAGYLDGKTDNVTIAVEGNKLVVKGIDGLVFGIADLNNVLSGADGNIQNQLNGLSESITSLVGGMKWLGKVETRLALDTVTTMENGSVALVLSDESRDGGRSLYVYSEEPVLWDFIGEFTFNDQFIALRDTPSNYRGHNGKVVKVDETNDQVVFGDVAWSEVANKPQSTPSNIDQAVDSRHQHNNLSVLNDLSTNEQGQITFKGVPITAPTIQPKQYLNALRADTDQNIVVQDTLIFNSAQRRRGIGYNVNTGHFMLERGKVYHIIASVKLAGFNTYTQFGVVRVLNGARILPNAEIISHLSSTSYANGNSGTLNVIFSPNDTEEYCVRFTEFGADEGAVRVSRSQTSLTIVEI